MLSLREKLALQKEIRVEQEKLKSGIENLRERLASQKKMRANIATLNGASAPLKTLLDRFLAGEFTKSEPLAWRKIFGKVYAEAKGQIDILREPILAFFDWQRKNSPVGVFESAMNYDFGRGRIGGDVLRQLEEIMRSGRRGVVTITVA